MCSCSDRRDRPAGTPYEPTEKSLVFQAPTPTKKHHQNHESPYDPTNVRVAARLRNTY
jgi:hypothetical protein